MTFPYTIIGETSFYAKYISYNSGTEGLEYSDTGDSTYTVSGYSGEETIIVIPSKYNGLPVVGIDDGVFEDKKITQFVVAGDNQYFQTADGVLFNKAKTSLICYPSGKVDAAGANVIQYYIPDLVERVGNYAFAGASYLRAIQYGDTSESSLKYIGNYSFKNCSSLYTLYIPKSVISVGDGAFMCDVDTSIASVVFSEEGMLETIGSYAFAGLSRLTGVILPVDYLRAIGGFAFQNCISLSEITLYGNSNYFASVDGVLYSKDMQNLIAYPAANKKQLSAVYEVKATKAVLSGAFSQPALLGIKLSATIDTLESTAFDGKNLKFVQFLGEAPVNYELNAFGNVSEEFEIYYPVGKDYTRFVNEVVGINKENVIAGSPIDKYSYSTGTGESQFLYGFDIDGKVVIYGYQNLRAATELVIPTTIGGIAVSSVAENAFYGDNIIKKLTLSEGITSIGAYAFSNMKVLESVLIPRTITAVADGAFADSAALSSVAFIPLPAETSEDEAAPVFISEMGANVFLNTPWYENSTDEYLVFANVLIKYNGFGVSAVIPDGVTVVADKAFENKTNLKTLQFNDKITTIGDGALFGCSNLYYIELPATVSKIGSRAFDLCDGLVCLKLNAQNPPTIPTDGNVFSLVNAEFEIEVPAPETKYEQASGWDYYTQALVARNEYEISYTPYDQSVNETVSAIYIEKIPEPRENDVFGGWYYEDPETTRPIYITYPYYVTRERTFFAKWYKQNEGSENLSYELINGDTEYAVVGYTGANTEIGKRVVIPSVYKDKPVTAIYSSAFSAATSELNRTVYSITIPDTISYIEENAFIDTAWYKNYLGDSVVCGKVFLEYKGEDVKKVVIPDGVQYFVKGAFRNNPYIEEVVFPEGVETIAEETMFGCGNLKKVVLPESLRYIESKAFAGCGSLKSISFPIGLLQISPDAFEDTAWIKNYSTDYIMINSILYKYVGNSAILHITNGVYRIEEEAFFSNVSLQNLFIPQSVRAIGKSAFEGCVNISTVEFSTGCMIETIEERAFYGCLGLKLFTFESNDNKIETIGEYAFYNTSSLMSMEFPSSLIVMGEYAFGNSNLMKATFGRNCGLVEIPVGAFSGCLNLHSVEFAGGSMLERIAADAFINCQLLNSIVFSTTKLVSIDENAFYNCVSLSQVSLPGSLNSIADGAFENTEYLRVQKKEMTIIGSVLLQYRGVESEVVIARNIITISDSAFRDNLYVQKIVFESGSQLTTIGANAFNGCTSLSEISFPSTVSYVGRDAFTSTAWLKNYVDDFVIINSVLVKYKGDDYQATIPAAYNNIAVTTIAGGAFDSQKLMNIVIGESITKIMEGAFDGIKETATLTMLGATPPSLARNDAIKSDIYVYSAAIAAAYSENADWSRYSSKISRIVEYLLSFDTLNPSVESEITPIDAIHVNYLYNEPRPTVSGYSFVGWYLNYDPAILNETQKYSNPISIPFQMTGDTVLYAKWVSNSMGTTLEQIGIKTVADLIAANEGVNEDIAAIYRNYQSESGFFINSYGGSDRLVMMPSQQGESKIIGVGVEAFANRSDIEEVYFVDNTELKYILDGAFMNCTKLRKIVLPSTLIYIGKNAFEGCTALKEIVFTDSDDVNLTLRIDERVFRDCTALESVTLSENVVYLGENVFEGCILLESLYLTRVMQNSITAENITDIYEDGIFGESSGYTTNIPTIYVPYSINGSARTGYLNSNWDIYSDYIVELPN